MESFQTPAGQMAADTLAGADVSPGPLFLFGTEPDAFYRMH